MLFVLGVKVWAWPFQEEGQSEAHGSRWHPVRSPWAVRLYLQLKTTSIKECAHTYIKHERTFILRRVWWGTPFPPATELTISLQSNEYKWLLSFNLALLVPWVERCIINLYIQEYRIAFNNSVWGYICIYIHVSV